MKIKIKIEDKNKHITLPVKKEEIRAIYDELWQSLSYYNEKYKKLPKDKKKTYKILTNLQNKLMHLIHDIIDKGVVYNIKNNKSIKLKKPFYVIKKPNWKKH